MANLLVLLVGALATGLALGAFVGGTYLLERRRAHWARRLKGGDAGDSGVLVAKAPLQPPAEGWNDKLDQGFERMVEYTGTGLTAEQALGLISMAGVVLGGAFYLWRDQLWLGLLGFLIGAGVPFTVFWLLRARYRRQLQEQLPDAFYLLARSLRAGLSLEQSLALSAEQGVKPLANEFRRCVGQVRLGLALPIALQMMADRIHLMDFNAFVSAVAFHRISGGNLALILDRLAAGTRDRNQFRGHLSAATAQGRITAIFLGLFGPIVLLVYALAQPAHVQAFFQSPTGWLAVAVALVLELIGTVWLYRLLRIEY
jgi:tight adherence protein B